MFKSRRLFPYLLSSFIVVSAVFSLSLSNISKKRVVLRQKATEEQNQLLNQSEVISQWVPINVNEFNQQTDKSIQELSNEIYLIKKQRLSSAAERKKLDPLEREFKIQTINKEEHNLMDENKDGKISYEEFNKRDLALFEKTYPLRHRRLNTLKDGLLTPEGKAAPDPKEKLLSGETFRVVVEAGIYDELTSSLNQYKADVESERGYNVQFSLCNNCTKEEIKTLLQTNNTVGAVLVGDLPVAWWLDSTPDPVIVPYQLFPIDLYYMDLDGGWEEKSNCLNMNQPCFVKITGDGHPEIFLGRLTVPSEAEEISLLNNYFRKNHLYRTSPATILPQKSLNYGDDSLDLIKINFVNKINFAYQAYETVAQPNSTAEGLKSRWQNLRQRYEHTFISAHSYPQCHWFSSDNRCISSSDIRTIKPPSFFFTIHGCSAARYTESDYLVGWYVFQESDFGLAAFGFTHPSGFDNLENYFLPLREKNHIGLAFKEWHLKHPNSSAMTYYGDKTLIGDPTLRVFTNGDTAPCINTLATPVRMAGPVRNATITWSNPLLTVKDISDPNFTCYPHDVVFSIWQNGQKIRSSGFIEGVIRSQNGEYSWRVSPSLPSGYYEWRANLRNTAGQTCSSPLIIPFRVSLTCLIPATPQRVAGPVAGELIANGDPDLAISDPSDTGSTCYPHDVVFSIWQNGQKIRSSNFIEDVLISQNSQYSWRVSPSLPSGYYEWRANLRNTAGQTCGSPLIIPFNVLIRPTPTPTPTLEPEPTPTPYHSACSRTRDGHVYCRQVPGEGETKCSTDLDCETCTDSWETGTCAGYCSSDRVCRKGEDNYCACYPEE